VAVRCSADRWLRRHARRPPVEHERVTVADVVPVLPNRVFAEVLPQFVGAVLGNPQSLGQRRPWETRR
jgi:hypothetical protein